MVKLPGIAHWELAAAAVGLLLWAWLLAPTVPIAGLAIAAALGLALGAVRVRRAAAGVVALVGAAAAMGALHTSLRVRAVETRWPEERERLIEDARQRLDATLGEAVTLAERLAERGLAGTEMDPSRAFEWLRRVVGNDAPERGVAVFDTTGRALSWAGRHRVPPEAPPDSLFATITPFYVVLRAQRQADGARALGEVLLAADGAVPDGKRSVAARFAARTGVGLEFYPPRSAPAEWTDVFDYCSRPCRDQEVVPDTLFSVRAVPPTQGAQKLRVLAAGERRVALGAAIMLLLLAATAGFPARYLGVGGLAALFLFARAGEAVGLREAFSPASFFWGALGPLSGSAGALLLASGLVTIGAVWLWRSSIPRPWPVRVVGFLLAAGTPFVLASVARGITPPTGGVPTGLWLTWQLCVTAPSVALLLVAAALVRSSRRAPAPRWTAWAAVGSGVLLAWLGLLVWQPPDGLPDWYVSLWVPALLLAVRPASVLRTVVAAGAVAGTGAALLTWGATVEGRLTLAARDGARLGDTPDPVAAGLLERFGSVLQAESLPTSAARLYRAWRRSPLAQDDYPALLAAWDSSGSAIARLDLAPLGLSDSLLQALARRAAAAGSPALSTFEFAPGVHYVLAVPYPDGPAVTVGIGPRSRVLPPVRVAQFLSGEPVVEAPFEVLYSDHVGVTPVAGAGSWEREGWVVRGLRLLDPPSGTRHLHITINLGEPIQLVIRGLLLIVLDILLAALLWVCGDALGGRLRLKPAVREVRRLRSYRLRLALALAVFFMAPTVGFAVWGVARLQAEAERSGRLLTRQTLRDAGEAARDLGIVGPSGGAPRRLAQLAARYEADLILYEEGRLVETSAGVLEQLGLLDHYVEPRVYRQLVLHDDLEVAADAVIGGRATRVGYRNIGAFAGEPLVLASPRLVDDAELLRELRDLAYTLILGTLLGLGTAMLLATAAARWLARPVHAIRAAAEAIGRGHPLPPLDPAVPIEFIPVVEGLEGMARDVRTSQAALEASRQRTAAVLRSVATGVVALDGDMRVSIANPRAEELLGVTLTTGMRAPEVTGAEWQPLWGWVEAFRRGGEAEPHELVVGERRIRAQLASLGESGGCVVALDDTTDLAHAVRVLAWGELARQIAHEIKNPLTPIRLGVQHLERTYRDRRQDFDATLGRTARQILAEIERLDAIARAFARFGAPPAEAGPLEREDLTGVARETVELYALGADTAVQVEAAGSVYGRVRRDELKEVLVNLIENARNAGARSVVVKVERAAGDGAQVTVQDNGRGIPAEHLPRIFEPHFSTTTSGTGLGLAICRRLVESWGGTIAVASKPGRGTLVTVHTAA